MLWWGGLRAQSSADPEELPRTGSCICSLCTLTQAAGSVMAQNALRAPPREPTCPVDLTASSFQWNCGDRVRNLGTRGPISCSGPTLTWMAWTSLLLSSRAAEAVDDPKEAAPRCSPRMRRPSFLYCSMGSHSRSRNPWTGGQDDQRRQACLPFLLCPRTLTPFPMSVSFSFPSALPPSLPPTLPPFLFLRQDFSV